MAPPDWVTGVPAAVPRLVYWPATAVPEAVYTHVSPGSRSPFPFASPDWYAGVTPAWSSVTVTPAIGSLPGLVTSYVQVTGDPTWTYGPGAALLSVPFVSFTRLIWGVYGAGVIWSWLFRLTDARPLKVARVCVVSE